MQTNDQHLFVQNKDLRFSRQVDGITIFNPTTGTYYALSESGGFIWECLSQPTSVSEVKISAATKYGIDATTIAADIERFIAEMTDEGLITSQFQ
jgi:Coenzyme PQQ synthesis protein D (PqqD)